MDFKKHSFILSVIENLQKYGSWTGKTHIQKTSFLLKVLSKIEVPFRFVLYKHGPYSFELQNEFEEMKSYAATVSGEVTHYGSRFFLGMNATRIQEISPLDEAVVEEIERICKFVNCKNVSDLEKIATVAWIHFEEKLIDPDGVSNRLHELKPHISSEQASEAYAELQSVLL